MIVDLPQSAHSPHDLDAYVPRPAYAASVYEPKPASAPTGTIAAALADEALQGRLTVYAGAGVSAASPTQLPGAAKLATLLYEAVSTAISMGGVPRDDLVAVADRVAQEPQGGRLLKSTILRVADLTGARPAYAHAALALLICEGAIVVIETNYDDCIERAALPERVPVVITDNDRLMMSASALLKAHGCATKPDTMLVTSTDLQNPPLFARNELAARLGLGSVVFLGIGSPADYVKSSLQTFMSKVGLSKLIVVGPQVADWATSGWQNVVGDLPSDQRVADTADEFADALLRAYVALALAPVTARVQHMDAGHPQRRGVERVVDALMHRDAVSVIRWVRSTGWGFGVGQSIAASARNVSTLVALGALSGGASIKLKKSGTAFLWAGEALQPEVPVILLQSDGAPLGTQVAIEARMRVGDARADDRIPPGADVIVVCTGQIGPLGEDEISVARGTDITHVLAARPDSLPGDVPDDLIEVADADHLIDSATAGRVFLVSGDALIDAA